MDSPPYSCSILSLRSDSDTPSLVPNGRHRRSCMGDAHTAIHIFSEGSSVVPICRLASTTSPLVISWLTHNTHVQSFTCVAVTFNAIHCSAKMSLLLYYRVLSPQLWWKVSIYATMCLVCGYCVSLFFAQLLACRPVAASWDITITNYTCIDRQAVFRATAVFGIVSDLILLLLPIPLVAQLHMPLTQKLGVVLVFAIASALVPSFKQNLF